MGVGLDVGMVVVGLEVGMVKVGLTMPQLRLTIDEDGAGDWGLDAGMVEMRLDCI